MRQRGFTLIEMLVATGVFMLGFSAAYTLFLAGVRYRTQASTNQRLAFALTSLAAELELSSGKLNTTGDPSEYVGNGLAVDGAEPEDHTDPLQTVLFPYPGQPGLWYRVMACTDLHNQSTGGGTGMGLPEAKHTVTLHARILLLTVATTDSTLMMTSHRMAPRGV